MKMVTTALTFDSEKGARNLLHLLLFLFLIIPVHSQQPLQVNKIIFEFNNSHEIKNIPKYKSLINIKEGDQFDRKKLRESLDNLYKTGSFSGIEARVEILGKNQLNLFFYTRNKYTIKSISVVQPFTKKKRGIRRAIYSLSTNSYLEESKIPNVIQELKGFLKSRGYNSPDIQPKIKKNRKKLTAQLKFVVRNNELTRINNLNININHPTMEKKLTREFMTKYYVPFKFQKRLEKLRKNLKKRHYYFPEISLNEKYLDAKQTVVDLSLDIDLGYKYIFIFSGINRQMDLISSIWEEKLFEKWAERESKKRILNDLKNRGYINARVSSSIETKNSIKYITFTVEKNRKYILGKIDFKGNRVFSDQKLKEMTKTDNMIYDRLFELRWNLLVVDLEILKLLYYFQGFPLTRINMKPEFTGRTADIHFHIREGDRYIVDSILINGNENYSDKKLLDMLVTRENNAFIQQTLNRDIERLKNHYLKNGFDEVSIGLEVSQGIRKSILIEIDEGQSFRMWNMIVIGASKTQETLIRKLFPLKKNDFFNQNKIDQFKTEIENTSIFSDVTIVKLKKQPDIVDVIVKVIPDKSRYYGFGIGWEDRRKFRGSVEYQERNIFNSYSTLSAILQIGFSERRGVLSLDTPYVFQTNLNSSFKIWDEDEIYPSYKFNRYGIGESIIKKITVSSYLMGSLNWYRTRLTELEITEGGVDMLDQPFDTTALSLSYVMEKRDDPFNPIKGDFFSTNLKIGLPLFEKDYSFFKFFWSYQKNIKLFKRSTLSLSIRNGFSAGQMSITERFFGGGIHSFRGTKNDRLGPLDPDTNEPSGGNALLLFNLEATFPLIPIPIEDLYYSFFADIGNVFETTKSMSLKNLEKALGFGIKYKTPIGPLRIDLAWNLNPQAEDDFLVQIGIGNVF